MPRRRAVGWMRFSGPMKKASHLALRFLRAVFSGLGPVFPGLMGGIAYRLWFRTRRHAGSADELSMAGSAEQMTVLVDGIPVAVYRWGSGPVVVFVHGWSGRATQVAAFVEPLNAAGYCVIAFDAPAHGKTPGRRTNIVEFTAVLQAIAANYGPLHGAITHSFGGMVLAYALHQGLAAGRVVCISTPARLEFLIERFGRMLILPDPVVTELRRRLEQRFDANVWELMSTDNNARTLTVPALIIHDRDDREVPWRQGEMVASAWSGARWLITHGLGHRRILRDGATVRAVVGFFAAASAGDGTAMLGAVPDRRYPE
jgi:pimeloyl-ACP methyl ester carboxylesterase